MKKIIASILAVLTLGCSNSPFFEFDEVIHYSKEISSDEIGPMYDDLENPETIRFLNVVEEYYPDALDDNFPKEVEALGYKKNQIAKEKFPEITEIFSEQNCFTSTTTTCTPVFRDILIFKKEKRIVGIAKICFECWKSHIVGTDKKTEYFGDCGNFEKLDKLLKQ